MRIAYLSPLPPARTGIAHYSAMLLPALRERIDVTPFASADGYRREAFDAAIYQLGNNPHHEWIYREAMEHPGIVVLHDVVLHHLIVEMTLARGDVEGFVAALEENHGAAGAAWARGRAIGLHHEMANFLMPASIELARRSRAVIVHNRWAAEWLESFGVATPIHVVPHPYIPEPSSPRRDEVRRRLGFSAADRVIGFFGFLTSAKRAEIVLKAFEKARESNPRLRLLIAGEPAPNIEPQSLARDGVVVTGYVPDEEFAAYYAAADRLVNLRYPSAGETSGTLMRAFDAGKPVAVSDYAQFAEYPDTCVVKIAFGESEVDDLAEFFLRDMDDAAMASAQRKWLEAHARLDLAVDGYIAALGSNPAVETSAVGPSLPLFVQLKLVGLYAENGTITFTIRNTGTSTIRTHTYGQPEYRIVAKLFDGGIEAQDRWLSLPTDLAPNETTTLSFAAVVGSGRYALRLYDGLQSIPTIDHEPWGSAEITL
jgi:glycosyltransferase involved in cell wall biosynthesis